jgi:UDP-N-acetylmuramoyl-tripeptide--D-alanyl-D-alanine ligase
MAFVNGNDPVQLLHSKKLNRVVFGSTQHECVVHLKDASQELVVAFNDVTIQSRLIGRYNFHNIAAAIAIGDHFKVSSKAIKTAIEEYLPVNNRSQIISKSGYKIILDAYNANPTSMQAALDNFAQLEADHKILFLGDMFELGTASEIEHQGIVDLLEKEELGATYLIGSNFYKTKIRSLKIQKYENFEALKAELMISPPKKSTILIKGSRGMALERILDCL